MRIRKSTENDVHDMMKLISQAQHYFKENNIDQWQNGYPNEDVILQDIKLQSSYVLEDEKIIGTMFFSFDNDPNYSSIEGHWLWDGGYGVIHRIVIEKDLKGKSLANELIYYACGLCKEKQVHSLRIDTHEDNASMRKLLKKNGFVECGIIYIDGILPRVAYEKMV